MTGRTSKFTPEIFDEICERISKGETLASICRDKDLGASTVYDWMAEDKALAGRFARAREKGFDAIAEDTLLIADGPKSSEDVQRDKLRVETRLKLLAKWDPKRYGDKLTHQGTGEGGAIVLQAITGVPPTDDTADGSAD